MIDRAAAMLKPGGTLVYCTCSLEPEEGEDQVAARLAAQRPRARPVAPAEIGGLAKRRSPPAGTLRTLPCHDAGQGVPPGMDGFFVMRLRKVLKP